MKGMCSGTSKNVQSVCHCSHGFQSIPRSPLHMIGDPKNPVTVRTKLILNKSERRRANNLALHQSLPLYVIKR